MPGQCGGYNNAVNRIMVRVSKRASTQSNFAIDRNFDQTLVQQARPPSAGVDQKFASSLCT